MGIFKSALKSWTTTWKENRELFYIELIGCLCGIFAAILINLLVNKPPMLGILTFYLISAICLAVSSHIRKSTFMTLLMTFYGILSIIGMFNLL